MDFGTCNESVAKLELYNRNIKHYGSNHTMAVHDPFCGSGGLALYTKRQDRPDRNGNGKDHQGNQKQMKTTIFMGVKMMRNKRSFKYFWR